MAVGVLPSERIASRREGKANKKLDDIKVGDRVWKKYEKTDNGLVAESIRILKLTTTVSQNKSS